MNYIFNLLSKKTGFKIHGIKKYSTNFTYQIIEYLFSLTTSFIIGIAVARYLGPQEYGILSYAISVFSIALIIVSLGLDDIIFTHILLHKNSQNSYNIQSIAGSSIFLKTIWVLIIYAILSIISFIYYEGIQLYILLIINSALLFQPLSIFSTIFLARAEGKYYSISRIISYSISALCKIIFIIMDVDVVYFAFAVFLDYSILYVMTFIIYRHKKYTFNNFKINKQYIMVLIKTIPYLFVALVFYTVYLKISIIVVEHLYSSFEAGIYTAAIRLIEALYLIPAVVVSSFYPAIINAKKHNEQEYESRIYKLFAATFIPFFLICLLISILSPYIIYFLYGSDYIQAHTVLSYAVWSVPFIAFYTISSKYFITENMLKHLLFRSILSVFLLLSFSLLFYTNYGIAGISISFTIAGFISFFLIDIFFSNTRKLFLMKLKSIFLPFIYMCKIIKNIYDK